MKIHEVKNAAWFCIRSQSKHEQIVAAHLRKMENVEVFHPRIRFKRVTRQGPVWVQEALFPRYLFGRFNWETSSRRVQAAAGVQSIVHFGDDWPVIPDQTIEELRSAFGKAELHTIHEKLIPGDSVRIAEGALRGLQAVVSRVMPGRERVEVLMEFLGQKTMTEVTAGSIIKQELERTAMLGQADSSSMLGLQEASEIRDP